MQFKLLKNKEKTKENAVLKNKKTREKSCGRSMVEMLGVLAIIGVLSIGGIQGYTLAMRKYRANEILNMANKYAATIWVNIQQKITNEPDRYFWAKMYANGDRDAITTDVPSDSEMKTAFSEDKSILFWVGNKNYFNDLGGGDFFRQSDVIAFSDSGLGGIPNGAKEFLLEEVSAGMSGIAITLLINFDNQRLCETVMSLIDYDKEVLWAQNDCRYSAIGSRFWKTSITKDGYPLLVNFYQK